MKSVAIAVACTLLACGGAPRPVAHPKYGYFSGPTITGTVTAVAAGTGLTGGTITRSGTIAADTTYLQRRVSGTCGAGNAVGTINADGTVTCNSAGGSGLSGLTTGDIISATNATTGGDYAGSTATSCGAGNAVTGAALSAAGALTTTCTAMGTVIGTGTTGDLPAWTSSTGLGNYAGSTGTACTGTNVMTNAALSAAGVLTTTCSATPQGTVTSIATSAPITGGTITSTGTLGLSESSNLRTSGGALDLSTAVTMPGSLTSTAGTTTVDKFVTHPVDITLGGGVLTDLAWSDPQIEITCAADSQIAGVDIGTAGQEIGFRVVGSNPCIFVNESASEATPGARITGPHEEDAKFYPGDGGVLKYDGTNARWGFVAEAKGVLTNSCSTGFHFSAVDAYGNYSCTADSGGGVTGSGTAGDLMKWSTSTAATNFAGSSCSAGTAATSIGATGALTCGITPLTSSNLSGTTNHLVKFTGTNTGGNSNATDDGTTFTVASGTPSFSVTESSGDVLINSAASPANGQLNVQANGAGGLTLLNLSAGNQAILYNSDWTGSAIVARGTFAADIGAFSNKLSFYGETGLTSGSSVSSIDRMDLALGTGQLTLNTGGISATAAASSFAGVTATGLTVNGPSTLGNGAATEVVGAFSVYNNGTIPTISGCGTGASISSESSNNAGTITMGTSPGATCTVTFSTATGYSWTNAPACVAFGSTSREAGAIYGVATTTTFPISGTTNASSGDKISYVCIGEKN